jgi:hypothetical protein
MKRRAFITGLGAVLAAPLGAEGRSAPLGRRRRRTCGLLGTRRMTSAVSRWFCLALALGACAALANTPEQNLGYERWAKCSRPAVTLRGVSVDGQIGFLYTDPADQRDVVQCLSDAGRTGPPLPPPVGFQPKGGA